ncbi:MAG TPA: hypothetical protein VF669_06620 [Tepidisphaeraceae bacterium]|jgi:hypothetical protein
MRAMEKRGIIKHGGRAVTPMITFAILEDGNEWSGTFKVPHEANLQSLPGGIGRLHLEDGTERNISILMIDRKESVASFHCPPPPKRA